MLNFFIIFQQLFNLSDGPTRSESFADLAAELSGPLREISVRSGLGSFKPEMDSNMNSTSATTPLSNKPFGLGKLTFRRLAHFLI